MITDREEFIKICGLLAHSDIQLEDCNYITNFIVELGNETEQLKEQRQELRRWLEKEVSTFGSYRYQEVLNKLNELEGKNVKNS